MVRPDFESDLKLLLRARAIARSGVGSRQVGVSIGVVRSYRGQRLQQFDSLLVGLSLQIDVRRAAQRSGILRIQAEHAIVGRQRLGVVVPFGVSLSERQVCRKQLGVALHGRPKGDQRRVGLFQPVARQAEKEENLAVRRRLMCLLKQARGSSIVTLVESPLSLIQCLAPGKRCN